MTLLEWVQTHRAEIDDVIFATVPSLRDEPDLVTDDEREKWVLNYEPLYLSAIDDGADI